MDEHGRGRPASSPPERTTGAKIAVAIAAAALVIGGLLAIAWLLGGIGGPDRQPAWPSLVKSELRNAATFQEELHADAGRYTDVLRDLMDEGFRPSNDVSFDLYANDDAYCMVAVYDPDPTIEFTFDSASGEVAEGDQCDAFR